MNKIVSVGWDVGGWMGKKQGIAVSCWNNETNVFSWLISPKTMSIPNNNLFDIETILSDALIENDIQLDIKSDSLVIAIDAPLGYPENFTSFILGDYTLNAKPDKEIYNPLAYRKTENHIYERFNKKPLSAVFDKLGNNATVAISHIRKWERDFGYVRYPARKKSNKCIIEVYPALVKTDAIIEKIMRYIPPTITNEDAKDAAISSILGIKKFVGRELLDVGKLIDSPDDEIYIKEGWIYYLES